MATQTGSTHGKPEKRDGGKGGKRRTGNDEERIVTRDGYKQPPAGSYDPALAAELRAVGRGLDDTLLDTKRERKQIKQDLRTALRDLAIELRRGRKDVRLTKERGLEDIEFSRSGIRLREARGEEDFMRGLDQLTRSYSRQAQSQTQAASAAGVLGGGTAAAAAAKRAENFAYDRQPLDVARARLGEDVERALMGLGTDEERLRQDTRIDLNRLRQDVRHDKKLTRRDARRSLRDVALERQRARREGLFAETDIVEQMVFDARQRHPGAFTKFGQRRR